MSARTCSVCNTPMTQGYCCCGGYFCSGECLDSSFDGTEETWESHYRSEEGSDCYWTVWESRKSASTVAL